MIQSPEQRAARKKAQVARLNLKGTPGYSRAYASQPSEIRKRALFLDGRMAENAAKAKAMEQLTADDNEAAALFSAAASVSANLTAGGDA